MERVTFTTPAGEAIFGLDSPYRLEKTEGFRDGEITSTVTQYIDMDGGVDISDCEAISRALDPILDEKDPVPDSYNFEVCSAGLERQLKRPSDFAQFMGSSVSVKLFKPIGGAKEFIGKLAGYADGAVTIDTAGTTYTFQKNEVAQVRLHVEF